MQLNKAVELVKHEINSQPQIWADLGAGSGIFTLALSSLLPPYSTIYAVDKNLAKLNDIPNSYKNIETKKINLDFIKENLPNNLDGILMANSFHYVEDKDSLIKKCERSLKPEGCFLIIEYDSDISNPWVPFPISYNSLRKLFEKKGYNSITKLSEHPSVYRRVNIYSALIKR